MGPARAERFETVTGIPNVPLIGDSISGFRKASSVEFCIQNDGFCIQNDGFCIYVDRFSKGVL